MESADKIIEVIFSNRIKAFTVDDLDPPLNQADVIGMGSRQDFTCFNFQSIVE